MVVWRRCHPALLRRLTSALPPPSGLNPFGTNYSLTNSSCSSRICVLRRRLFHGGGANLEDIAVGTLPLDAYNELVKAGHIRQDQNQVAALQPLERLHQDLENYTPSPPGFTSKLLSSFRGQKETPRGYAAVIAIIPRRALPSCY